MIRKTLPLLIVLFCLSGCYTMAPKYTRPNPPVPASWPTGEAYKGTAATPAGPTAEDVQWRAFYKDERLGKLIDIALKNNRDLRVATLNIEKARALYRIQRAALLPSVNATGTGNEQRVPEDLSYSGRPTVTRQWGVTVGFSSYELDFFGRVRSLKDQALEQYLATEEAQRSARISLMAEVAFAWLTRAADCERLKVSRDTFESQEKSYQLIRRRYEVGTASELDLSQAQTRVDAARVDIALYTGQVAQDENALSVLLGATVPRELLSDTLSPDSFPSNATAGLSSAVLLKRPDILQAEHQLKAANANIGAARAAFFPMITLTTGAGTLSSQLSGLFTSGQDTWNFMPQITLPIFDAGSRMANLDAATADRDINLALYEKTIQAAFREVADALAVRGTVGDQLTAQSSMVKASDQAYRLSDLRYTKGIDNYLGVLDAQRSLFTARLRLVGIRYSQLANLVSLYKSLGGGTEK